jgi:hypothetical protein
MIIIFIIIIIIIFIIIIIIIIISPSMSLTGLSLEIYIIHFVAQLRDFITRDPSDQSSHNWRR